jgi:hypothetical protein
LVTYDGSPSAATVPFSSRIARSHIDVIASALCDTRRMVFPASRNDRNLSQHFFWNRASPTDRASSTIRMSGLALTTVLKVSRACMPVE